MESDTDVPNGPELGDSAFRISVNLTEYFQHPARCFLWVPPPRESRTVRWLARRLRRTAALRERFCLLCAGHMLPPEEPLQMLRPGDSLSVVQAKQEWQRVFSFRGERLLPSTPKTKKQKNYTIESEPSPAKPTPSLPMSVSPSKISVPPLQLATPLPILKQPQIIATSELPVVSSELSIPPLTTTYFKLNTPPSTLPQTSATPVTIKRQDDELQRVKRRALELLQKVEGKISHQSQGENEGGEDETDGLGEGWPAKKRRRRVRRRKPLPPIDFEKELALSTNSDSIQPVSEGPGTPNLALNGASTPELFPTRVTSTPVLIPAPSFTPVTIPAPSFTPVLPLSPPAPVVLREVTAPRLPRLVRALDPARSDDVSQLNQEQIAPASPVPIPQAAVQCS